MHIRSALLFILISSLLAACNSYDFSRREVQQGNLLPYSKFERLKIGMSKQEVAILMGTSLISSPFTKNRWDYAYTWRKGNGPMTIRRVSLHFANDKLIHINKHL